MVRSRGTMAAAARAAHERVLSRGVQLCPQHPLDVAESVDGRPVHLRQRPQAVRVLHTGAGSVRVRAEQFAQPPRGGGLTRMRPRRLHGFGVRLRGAGQSEMAERGDLQLRVEQRGQVLMRERRSGQRTARELVEPDGERAAGDVRADLLPGPAGVTAQQPQAMAVAWCAPPPRRSPASRHPRIKEVSACSCVVPPSVQENQKSLSGTEAGARTQATIS
jgi:hypothetical protein